MVALDSPGEVAWCRPPRHWPRWGHTFTSSGAASSDAMHFQQNFVASADFDMEVATLEDLGRVLARASRSAPGHDGFA